MEGWRLTSRVWTGAHSSLGQAHGRWASFSGKLVSMETPWTVVCQLLKWKGSLTNGHWMAMGGSGSLLITAGSGRTCLVHGPDHLCPRDLLPESQHKSEPDVAQLLASGGHCCHGDLLSWLPGATQSQGMATRPRARIL